jgi:drug/metabolite transporter (DMT)-like permease
MEHSLISLLLAFCGYSLLNIGQACQKIGLEDRKHHRLRGWSLWIGATAATFVSVLVVYAAISLGSVSLVGAMSGSGLASLTLFSRFVMKEKITNKEYLGLAFIIIASVFIGTFSTSAAEAGIHYTTLYLFFAAIVGFYCISGIVTWRKQLLGMVLGGFSGSLAGFSSIFQKVTTTESGSIFFHPEGVVQGFFQAIANPLTLVWILLSLISMIVLQFSYKYGRAIRIIPSFTVNFILMPVIGGLIVFSEALHILQWFGIAIMVSGSLLVTIQKQQKKETA